MKETKKLKSLDILSSHMTGVIPILPIKATPENEILITELNKKITAYHENFSAPNWHGLLTGAEYYGPSLGPGDRERPDSLIKKCVDAVPREVSFFKKTTRYDRIRNAMNCVSCHDGRSLGALSVGLNPFRSPVLRHFVMTTERMPPGEDLTREEREALLICLAAEYAGKIQVPQSTILDKALRTYKEPVTVDSKKDGLLREWLRQPSRSE